MSFMMIFTCVIPISAQSTNRPAESSIVDILEDILGKDDPEIEMKTGTMKIGQTKTVKVDGDLAMHIYQLDVAKETSIQLKANTNAQVFEVAITSDELEPVWEDFVVNEKKDNKELTTDLKLKAGSYAVVVTATKGTSTITSTVKSTALKTISPFTVDAVLPGTNVVSGTGLKGATVKVVTSEFKTYTTTVDQNGKYSVKIPTQEEYDSIMQRKEGMVFSLTDGDRLALLKKKYSYIKDAYELLGMEQIRELKYHTSHSQRLLISISEKMDNNAKVAKLLLTIPAFRIGEFIPSADIKDCLNSIYGTLGIKGKASIKDFEDYAKIKEARKRIDGKQIRGYIIQYIKIK